MAIKKPTVTLGKGTPAVNTTRPVSAKPSDASKLNAAKRTTSSGITTRPDGRPQSEGRSGRQATSNATVSNSGQGVSPGSAGGRVTTGQGNQPPKPTAVANLAKSQQLLRDQFKPVATFLSGTRGLAAQAIIEAVAPRPTSKTATLKEGQALANATMKANGMSPLTSGGQPQKPKAAPKPKPAPKLTKAQSFDNAFASARSSGMKTFYWEGKRYTTKLK